MVEAPVKEHVRVLLVDDHDVTRIGLRRMLELETELVVVGEASSGEEVIHMAWSLAPDVILMDVQMPSMSGLEALRRLKEQQFPGQVIMLSFSQEYLPLALEAGGAGYLVKDVKRQELVEAIHLVNRGEVVIGNSIRAMPGVTEAAMKYLRDSGGRPAAVRGGAAALGTPSPAPILQLPSTGDLVDSGREQIHPAYGKSAYGKRVAPDIEQGGPAPQPAPGYSQAANGHGQPTGPNSAPDVAGSAGVMAVATGMELGAHTPTSGIQDIKEIEEGPQHPSEAETGPFPRDSASSASPTKVDTPREDIELVIHPPVSAAQLTALNYRLTKQLKAQIVQTIGSWKDGVRLRLRVAGDVPAQEILERLPEVAAVHREPSPEKTGKRHGNSAADGLDSWSGPTWRIELKLAADPKQLPLRM